MRLQLVTKIRDTINRTYVNQIWKVSATLSSVELAKARPNQKHANQHYQDLINDNLNQNVHHDATLNKVYRTLGLIQRTFSRTTSIPNCDYIVNQIPNTVLFPCLATPLALGHKKLEQLQC